MRRIDGIAVFGSHEDATIDQMRVVAERAEQTVLCADAHVGYVMPIGGVAAYREQVSVVGVGFDIACLAEGTPVVTADGYHLPIERVAASDAVLCCDAGHARRVQPNLGMVARGVRPTIELRLANGRTLRATPDHELLTRDGWREAGALAAGERVACSPYVGLPFEPVCGTIDVELHDPTLRAQLAGRGLHPLDPSDRRFPALVRLLGCVSGDGHLARDGRAVSVYTVHEQDALDVAADFGRIGFRASVYRRARGAGRRDELCVRVSSRAAHALFASLGSPVGRKQWPARPMEWLFGMPKWVRAQYLSAFASAEMMTPRVYPNGTVPNLQLKQAGADDHAIAFVARLLRSLDFEVSVAPSGAPYGDREVHVLQILGGQAAQLRFVEQVGFCHAREKRLRGAALAGTVWAHRSHVAAREAAKAEARALHAGGVGWRDVVADVSRRHEVPEGFVYHAIYDRRGTSRRLPGAAVEGAVDGEVCWVPVERTSPGESVPVYDVATGDPAHCFLADGVVAHNCGNAAIRTDVTLAHLGDDPEEVRRTLGGIADEIASTVSFGMGRRNRADDAPVDHPLFADPAWGAVPPRERQGLFGKARQQLGTVGSGNHYVDVFVDEQGALWVGVHFGSRGFGHTVASAFLAIGQGKGWGERVPEREVLLDLSAPSGHDYWALMNLAGRYAYAGREWVARKVVQILGGNELELVHNHHNFAWKEMHGGEEVVVVRKGATPAFPGQTGFIGGSMGDDAVIVQGTLPDRASEEVRSVQQAALYSTVHGAGRVMSRTQAAGKRNRRTGKVLSVGRVTPDMMKSWVAEKGVILRGGGLDESPHVYRRLPDVLAAQEGTIEVLHTLRPLIVVMAGADEFDPYKD